MKRILWFTLALIGVVALAAACDPFGTPHDGDYVVFETCPTTSCAPGESNILVMKSPTETVVNGVTTREGQLQLRLGGRDGAEHDYNLLGTIVEDAATPSNSSMHATVPTELSGQWQDALGIDGLDLADVALTGTPDPAGHWHVELGATPTITPGTPAADLAPPFAPGVNTFSSEISSPDVPVTAGIRLGAVTLGEYHFESLDFTKTTWPGHARVNATVTGASATVSGVALSDVDATIDIDASFAGTVHLTGNVGSGSVSLPVAVDLPVHLDGGDIVAGPDAQISIGVGSGISLAGTFTVSGVLGGGPTSVTLADATLTYGTTRIPVSASVVVGPGGVSAELHAGTAQLTPGVLLHNADLTWNDGTLTVQGAADLTGKLTAEGASVTGTATISGGAPSVDLNVAADRIRFELKDQGTIDLADVHFHIGGNFTGGTLHFDAALALDHGVVGNTTIGGNVALSGQVALGDSFTVKGWSFDLDTTVDIDAIHANAALHGSGGSLYDGSHGGIGCVSVPVGVGGVGVAKGVGGLAGAACDGAEVTGVFDIVDSGNGIGGTLRVELWMDGAHRLHVEAAGNAHLTIGSKVVVDGAVQISDNKIHLNGNVKFGTKLEVPTFGTVTIDPNNPLAVPTVDLALGKTYLTKKLWLDNVHITNGSNLTHFAIDGQIDNAYGAKTLGLVSISQRFGALNVAGSIDLGAANLTDPDTTNVSYDLSITAPDATNSSPLLWLFYANTNDFDFHVWGDSHTAHLSLSAEATLFAGLRPLGAGANIHIGASGSVNLDTGAVSAVGNAQADAFVNLGVVADGSANANVTIVLSGNINSSVTLAADGYGTFSANALGFVPIASGDGELHGNVSISMASGSISGTADFAYGIDVVGGLFGNDDGDWHYNLSGTVSQPVVTAHDSYTRHNHHKGENISGQVYPVRNLCGNAYRKKKFLGIGFNWTSDGQWGDCAANGTIEGKVLVDTDGNRAYSGADTPLPEGSQVAVTVTDASDGGSLVGQGITAADGTFSAPVVVRAGHTYQVSLSVPGGYAYAPGTSGYAPGGGGSVASPSAGQTRNVGTFGIAPRSYGSVTGVVFDDANHNGVRDAGEPGIPGVALIIDGRPAISGPGGHYDMNLLEAGRTVTVALTKPSGWSVTADPDGVADGSTQVQVVADTTTTVGGFGLCHGASCVGVGGPGPLEPLTPLAPVAPVDGPDGPVGPVETLPAAPEGRELEPVS